mgnify:CR=1 FL=1|jgi:hypothetical protein
MGLGKAVRKNMDAIKYRRTAEGKEEAKARKAHNKKFYPDLDKKTKRHLRFARIDADAKKTRMGHTDYRSSGTTLSTTNK